MADQTLVARTFVALADTMVEDYDVVDFLDLLTERCVMLLGVSEAGVVLADPVGALRVMASSSERMRLIELFEVQSEDGPCRDAFLASRRVDETDLVNAGPARWPRFAPVAIDAGIRAVYAWPMRLRGASIGALNLFINEPATLSAGDVALAQALADIASIGIIHERLIREQSLLSEQLQAALNSRVIIEQAKGAVAAQSDLDVDESFRMMRSYARRHRLRLSDVANDIVLRRVSASDLSG